MKPIEYPTNSDELLRKCPGCGNEVLQIKVINVGPFLTKLRTLIRLPPKNGYYQVTCQNKRQCGCTYYVKLPMPVPPSTSLSPEEV